MFRWLILKIRGGGGKLLLTSLRVYDNLDKNTVIYHLEEFNKKGVSGFVVKRRNDTVPHKELKYIISQKFHIDSAVIRYNNANEVNYRLFCGIVIYV